MTYDAQQRRRTVSPPFFAEALLLNLFMKTFTRARVVPIIAANVSCEIFGIVPVAPARCP